MDEIKSICEASRQLKELRDKTGRGLALKIEADPTELEDKYEDISQKVEKIGLEVSFSAPASKEDYIIIADSKDSIKKYS